MIDHDHSFLDCHIDDLPYVMLLKMIVKVISAHTLFSLVPIDFKTMDEEIRTGSRVAIKQSTTMFHHNFG